MRVAALLLVALLTGCRSAPKPTTQPKSSDYVAQLRADCPAPAGWKASLLSTDNRHAHMLWLSPTGQTAYAIIHINLPFPVAPELVLWVTMREMKRIEGESTLISSNRDPTDQTLRFIAQGRDHVMDARLLVQGFEAWVIYAGTFRDKPVNPKELDQAEKSREMTVIKPD